MIINIVKSYRKTSIWWRTHSYITMYDLEDQRNSIVRVLEAKRLMKNSKKI